MKNFLQFLVLGSFITLATPAKKQEVPLPTAMKSCLDSQSTKGLSVDARINPFYLRGDFDGDGKPDLAVMVRHSGVEPTGLLMCQGNGRSQILGAGIGTKFSTMRDDNFLSSDWEVISLAEFRRLVDGNKKVSATAKGEVILLNWEDGSAYVYWDGSRYCWYADSPQ